ncbi:MAG: class I SAM-dependent methyltransferase [Chitinophagaceae bacterium]
MPPIKGERMSKELSEINGEFNPSIIKPAYLIRKCLLKYIRKYAPELTGSVMDFGCGSKPYKSLLINAEEYVGVDFQGQGHSHENEQIDVFYDGLNIPFDNNRFDGIFTSEVFEHVFNLEHIVGELNRVLKPGGKIFITCPFAICEHEQPNDFARYTSFGLKDLLERNGFTIISFEKAGTSMETICQIFISYFYFDVIRRLFGKIPGVRTVVALVFITLLNVISLFLNLISPKGKDLYMNNVVLAVKK